VDRRCFLASSLQYAIAGRGLRPVHPPTLIDSHVHVWKHSADFPFAEGAKAPDLDITAEDLLNLMQANGVARTVLIQVIHYRWDNRYLLEVLRRYPGKFQGVCRVNPEDPAAPDHLSLLTQEGCHGVRLSPDATSRGDWIRGPLMAPLWRRCAQLRVPMTLLLPASRLPAVAPWIEKNPELTVVIDHMSDVPADDAKQLQLLLAMARYARVYVKISHMWSLSRNPHPYLDLTEQILRLRDAFGANRLMWGTDWPILGEKLSYERRVALYRDHLGFLSSSERSDVLYKTVQRVWPFGL
jgi:predicted TIM-barrel fold metal-dependent hydrolase